MAHPPAPLERIRRRLSSRLSEVEIARLPDHYVRLGDVLILDLADSGGRFGTVVAEAFARELGSRSVLVRSGPITGEFRLPQMSHVWGDPDTETTHVENGVRYRFDPARIMFSPGNLPERQRVASLPVRGETVVDLFAGIGYFTLPLAVHGRPDRIYACEKNPHAYGYLEENIRLNRVEEIVEPRLGDNRDVAPIGQADRVLMGYLPEPTEFLPLALSCLKPAGGSIHYHTVVDVPLFPQAAFHKMQETLSALHWNATLKESVTVKSYAPSQVHGVLDVEVRPRAS